MNFSSAIRSCFSKYVTFSGRACRSEFWYFMLFTVLGSITLSLFDIASFGSGPDDPQPFSSVFSIAVFLPMISVTVRRLHDTDRSGWWYWLALIPLIGWIILLIWYGSEGTSGANRYGQDPLGRISGDDHETYSRKTSIPKVTRD